MSPALRVLFTNIVLTSRSGTEGWIKDAALGLRRRGHDPVVYSPALGEIAAEMRAAGVPVVDDLAAVGERPDVIHGHHHPQTVEALLRFPGVPALFVSHDAAAWHDATPLFPRIYRYVAVDEANRDRLRGAGVAKDRIRVLPNWVDLERFRPRSEPLPERPRRALVFSNYAREDTYLPAVREACRRAGLELDILGAGAGRPVPDPESVLGGYDLVFAKARCALESLAVGTAVVLCDFRGLGPLVTGDRLDDLRRDNLGARLLTGKVTPEALLREIDRYDPQDAAEVSRRVRETAGLEPALDRLLGLYEEVLEESREALPADPAAELRAAAAYIRQWAGPRQEAEVADLWRQRGQLESELVEAIRQRDRLEEVVRTAGEQRERLEEELRDTREQSGRLESELVEAIRQRDRLEESVREAGEQRERLEGELRNTREELRAAQEELRSTGEELRSTGNELRAAREERDLLGRDLRYVMGTATWRLRGALLERGPLRAAWQTLKRLASRKN